MFLDSKLWQGQKYHLDKMTLADLVTAYFAYPAIRAYIVLAFISGALAILWAENFWPLALSVAAGIAIYGLVWYLLHRFILHGRFLYKSPRTAKLWKRIHFDHHQDPNDLGVLFGALPTTLPTIFIMTIPIGLLIGGPAGGAAALTAGLLTTCYYEFCHCIQHLAYAPRWNFLRRIKKLHLAHHFHNEQGNYGITNFFWDRITQTYYPNTDQVPRSSTVFNLGYQDTETKKFPWVAELTQPQPAQPKADNF